MPAEDTNAAETTFLYELARNAEELKLVEYLIDAEKPLIRRRAAELLGGLVTRTRPEGEDRTERALVRVAKHDEHDAVRAAAFDALYLRDEDRIEGVIEEVAAAGIDETPDWMRVDRPADWLRSDHAEFRLVAAAALGEIGDPAAIPALVDGCADPDVRVRTRSVRSCGQLGDPRCIDAVASRLDDSHDQVRRAAARSLASIGTERALRALEPALTSDTVAVRRIAFGALGVGGTAASLPLLIQGLEDSDERVRRTAARSVLKRIANAPAERSHEIRIEVLSAVEVADPPDLESQLLTILGGNQPQNVRRNAIWLLGNVAGDETDRLEAVQTTLIEALADPDDVTAKFAMSTLIELDGEGTGLARHLRRWLENDDLVATARSRGEFVLEKVQQRQSPSRDAVTNAVEFTYVSEPSDYTATKRARDQVQNQDWAQDQNPNEN